MLTGAAFTSLGAQIGIGEHQPFGAGAIEVDLHAGMLARPFKTDDRANSEFLMADIGTQLKWPVLLDVGIGFWVLRLSGSRPMVFGPAFVGGFH